MPETVSAGTYNYVIQDCSCTGNTQFYSPHPEYVNPKNGDTVIQISSIELGGFNGLNN
jgi:hypothetical protein